MIKLCFVILLAIAICLLAKIMFAREIKVFSDLPAEAKIDLLIKSACSITVAIVALLLLCFIIIML